MAAGPIFNAIADLTRLSQHRTIERIAAVSGATATNVVVSLKANKALLVLTDENISLSIPAGTDFETGQATVATSWNGS